MSTVKPLQIVVRPEVLTASKLFAERHGSLFADSPNITAVVSAYGLLLDCTWYGDLDAADKRLSLAYGQPLIWSDPQIAYRYVSVTNDRGIAREIVLEPLMLVHVETPDDISGTVMGELSSRRGQIQGMSDIAHGKLIWAEVPLSELVNYPRWLREHAITATVEFSMYAEAPHHGPRPNEPKSAALRA